MLRMALVVADEENPDVLRGGVVKHMIRKLAKVRAPETLGSR